MRLTGVSFDDAARSVMARFSIQKLDSLVEDLLDSTSAQTSMRSRSGDALQK
jgi:hypothetical protein